MAITIDFKKYLASALRTTRWGELIEAYQSVLSELDEDLIEKMLNQYDLDNATITDYQNLLYRFGWNYSTYVGWTSQLEYFKRQALTCVDRIKYKNTRRAYLDELYVFNLTGDVYPLKEETDETLTPYLDWWTSPEVREDLDQKLDPELPNILYIIPYGVDRGFALDVGYTFDEVTIYYDDPIDMGGNRTYLDYIGESF